MNQVIYNKIFEAIKSDNLVDFSNLIQGNENLCFGRFPLLSLCYLYNAKKIIKKHKNKLLLIEKYKIINEKYEIYKNFRVVSGKCLRLFSFKDFIISPIEMMAILHKDSLVKKYYKYFSKNVEITENISKIYFLNNQKYYLKNDKPQIGFRPLNYFQKSSYKIALLISVVFVALFLGFYSFFYLSTGIATSWSAFEILNEQQLIDALRSDGVYKLKNDLTLNNLSIDEFNGTLDGDNHTIYIEESNDLLIKYNCGIIKNLNIKYRDIDKSILNSFSLLVGENFGTIENINIECEKLALNAQKSEEKDIYINSFANLNKGIIAKCTLNLNAFITATSKGECFVSGFVGRNNGQILDCQFSNGEISTNEADVSGVVIFNENNGLVSGCKNRAKISQTSTIDLWSPNVSGIALTNYGAIENSYNFANLKVESLNETENAQGTVFLGGISCMNYGIISNCLNKANLDVFSKQLVVYCGGITAYSIYDESSVNINLPIIKKCGVQSNINVQSESETAFCFVGGISGFLYGEIRDNYSLATFENGFDKEKYFVGTCVGSSYLQYQIFSNVICLIAENDIVLSQLNVEYQVGCLLNNGNIVTRGVVTASENIILFDSEEEIKNQEVYWDE